MIKRFCIPALTLALFGVVMAAGTPPSVDPSPSGGTDPGALLGRRVADFKLPDITGREHTLSELKGRNGVVLIFISARCQVANFYGERMEKLARDYAPHGINTVGIDANVAESAKEIKSYAAAYHLTFTILKDKNYRVADLLGATRTPEAFFLDGGGRLLYYGSIDSRPYPARASIELHNYLRDAIEATLAGRPIARPSTDAFGCTIRPRTIKLTPASVH